MSPLTGIAAYSQGLMPRVAPLPGKDIAEIPSQLPGSAPVGGSDFSAMLGNLVSEVNGKQMNAAQQVNALQAGQSVPLHQAIIAMEEASVSFQLMVEVRNKLMESYQEIMRMQI